MTDDEHGSEVADLLVIGFGPVGATLAGLAARHGVSVVAVDRSTELYPFPRAAHCDHEILRILQQLGCADEIVATMRVNEGMDFLSASREVLLRFQSTGLAPTGWPASVLFHQPGFESAMRRAVARTDAEVRLGVGVAALEPGHDAVRVTLDDGWTLAARYAVGCDGARSMVRRAIGSGVHDLEFEEPWLVVDLVLREQVPGLPDRALQVCDPARPHTLVPMPWPRFRFEFMLLDGEDPDAMQQPDRVRELVAAWIDPARSMWSARPCTRSMGSWRSGGVRGESFSPATPRTKCHRFSARACAPGCAMPQTSRGSSPRCCTTARPTRCSTPIKQNASPTSARSSSKRWASVASSAPPTPTVAANRDVQMLSASHDTGSTPAAPPPLMPLVPGPTIGPGGGGLAPQPSVDGQRLDDLVGPRFLVVTAEPLAANDTDGQWWAERAAVFDVCTTPELRVLLDAADAIVVRPDRYVFGRGDIAHLTRDARAMLESAVPLQARQRVR